MNEVNEIKTKTFGYISAALGLVAGLAWNDAIKALIESIVPTGESTVFVKFIYALVVTIVVVLLIQKIDNFINKKAK